MTPTDSRGHAHALVEWIADYLTGSELQANPSGEPRL
jgi:hypothetical protein